MEVSASPELPLPLVQGCSGASSNWAGARTPGADSPGSWTVPEAEERVSACPAQLAGAQPAPEGPAWVWRTLQRHRERLRDGEDPAHPGSPCSFHQDSLGGTQSLRALADHRLPQRCPRRPLVQSLFLESCQWSPSHLLPIFLLTHRVISKLLSC